MTEQKMRKSWKQDAEGVKNDILTVALNEFSERGLAGARIDEIAEKTRTSKRMIYYYFGDKEGLYLAALEHAYAQVQAAEKDLHIDHLPPVEAMSELIGFIFDHHRNHPDLMRIVMGENINNGSYLKKSDFIRDLNIKFVSRVEAVLARGKAEGLFKEDADANFIHWQIQAQSVYNVSNRASYSFAFGNDLFTDEGQAFMREQIIQSALCGIGAPVAAMPA